ncbi:MAG: ATP-binding protein [Methylococcales bacterium]
MPKTILFIWVDTTVLGNPVRIGQVIINILSNAVKFTPSGRGISIPFDLESEDNVSNIDRSPALSLVIRDQGIGIPENELDHVFNKFRTPDLTEIVLIPS